MMSELTPNTPSEIPGLQELQRLVVEREKRVKAWDVFTQKTRAAIMANRLHRQPQDHIDALLEAGSLVAPTAVDLYFSDTLAITEVTQESDNVSLGWEITYNCLSSSSGDFAPYNPPKGQDYYSTQQQALIALSAWLNDKMQSSYEILMGNDSANEIDVNCPECGLPFVVDSDGDLIDSFPGESRL